MNLSEIEKIIGYTFKNKQHIITAFTHSSYANENNVQNNEVYEFLGDSLLGFVVAENLIDNKTREGELSSRRAEVVNTVVLSRKFEELGLDKYVHFGQGEVYKNHTGKKVHADTMEAVFAAVYYDGGYSVAKSVIERIMATEINLAEDGKLDTNYKGQLQEIVQDKKLGVINYVCTNRDDYAVAGNFNVIIYIDNKEFGKGQGKQIKLAEQNSAKMAISKIYGK